MPPGVTATGEGFDELFGNLAAFSVVSGADTERVALELLEEITADPDRTRAHSEHPDTADTYALGLRASINNLT